MEQTRFRHIITGDENWFYFEYQHPSQWSVSRDEAPHGVDLDIGTAKFMPMITWGVNGFRCEI
jgi:hypothetical protein